MSRQSQAQANGQRKVTFELGPDGTLLPAEADEDEEESGVRVYLPDNHRGDYHGKLWPDPNRGNCNGNGGGESK